jgi:hypothetical protein
MTDKIDVFTMFTWLCAGIMLMLVGICVLSLPLMLLWNWLMPYLFGLPTIDIFQAVGIGVLSHILFGNTNRILTESGKGHKNGNKKSLLFD